MAKHPASHNIALSLSLALGQDIVFTSWKPVSGGSIHQAWQVDTTCGLTFFIKTNAATHIDMFKTEAYGLEQLQQHIKGDNPLRLPNTHTVSTDDSYAWLITEFIPFAQNTAQSEKALGQGLALLHQQSNSSFGLAQNNYIGETPQTNKQSSSWLNFFKQQRLLPQFEQSKSNGFYAQIQTEAEQILEALPSLLNNHQPIPSLLHGDLWSGNKGCDEQGKPIIFDPAIYYGDRECDLAMTELFGGFSAEFYQTYNDVYPLDPGYRQRKHLYNLYHILNHANLFSGSYIQQSKTMMQQLLS